MESAERDPRVVAAIGSIDAGLDVLLAEDWVPADVDEAAARVRECETLSRRLHAAKLGLQERIGRSGVHRVDGHASAKVMVRHHARLSNDEALRRDKAVRAQRELPAVAAGLAAGRVGIPQVDLIARVFANTRVGDLLVEVDEQIARAAAVLSYKEFEAALRDWERLADEDGAGDKAERDHAGRDFRMPRNLDGSHRFDGGGGSGTGQVIEDIWQRQVEREWAADWADARRRLGDAASKDDLARTDAQRRYDAMQTCFVRGDLAEYGAEARTCTDLVIDEVTFERHLAKLFGTDPGPDPRLATWWDDLLDTIPVNPHPVPDAEAPIADRALEAELPAADGAPEAEVPDADDAAEVHRDPSSPSGGGPGRGGDLVGFRCGTVDGRPLDPTEVVVATLIGQVRRVVTRADGVVLDMGRRARCFTGARQLAVRLADASCIWTGCDVPSSQCQCDHIDSFNGPAEGRTEPENGCPQCGRHNRLKEQGFTVVRDERGRYHVFRPDGREIT